MLNLRRFNGTSDTESSSEPPRFSNFSIGFRVPTDLLGNIGQPLDHGDSDTTDDYGCWADAAAAGESSGTEVPTEYSGPTSESSGTYCADGEMGRASGIVYAP